MEVTLLINGQKADFAAFLTTIVENAIANIQAPAAFTPEFSIDPHFNYKLTDERLQKLFGVSDLKHPAQSIINALRSVGIEPQKNGRRGSMVFGYQVVNYLDELNKKQTSYLSKN